ncbi:hypothetical protein [Legionella bononiensis]|uniref:Coiled-coil protein n=1 Tax=Legionella bononiensis TaxID=2793102 RepID=A0ABS1W8D5_9GAMM|nr:hypothetical protein [Legionella bononiensis]MBL7479991.1 hypothetical protein [Legionella bononiensis]MBL7525495.1 hypothetical protein [Legionella bononiensis]MBL7561678.1 hypothetical protein [Legionella bononiensis]
MNSKIDSLELALKQSLQGLFPKRSCILDYTEVKKRIKNEVKIALNVGDIDKIILLITQTVSDAQHKDPALLIIDQARVKVLISNNNEIVENVQNQIGQQVDINQASQMIEIVIEEMNQFHDTNKFLNNLTSRSKTNWDANTYASKKSQLDHLFDRELLKEEFHLIAETWFHYMVFAEDLRSPDNYTKEQIKELKRVLIARIRYLEGVVKSSREAIDRVCEIDRFLLINIEAEEKYLLDTQNQLDESKALAERLRQDNGYELSANHIQQQAYFSAFFLGELLGLHEPQYSKDGNPLLTFLDILTGWTDAQMDKYVTRKRISTTYSIYKQFKLNPNNKPFIDNLFRCHQEQKRTLKSILKEFQSYLLKLSIKPCALSITHDA